jgi:hypothetical protein
MMNKRKMVLAGIILAVLIISVLGIYFSFKTPVQSSSKETVNLVNFQHNGLFNYRAKVQPAIYYDSAVVSRGRENPVLVPVAFINSFRISFYFQSAVRDTRNAELKAVLESPGMWEKIISLSPSQVYTGDLEVPASINTKYFLELGDQINKEIGTSSSAYNLTIIGTVTGNSGVIFTQSMPLKISKNMLTIPAVLNYTRDEMNGHFDYQIQLTENTLYGAVTLTPAPPQSTSPPVWVNSTDTVFNRLIDKLDFTYVYKLNSDRPVSDLVEEVQVEAVLTSPDKWTKKVLLVPGEKKTNDFNILFTIKWNQFMDLFDAIQRETGVTSTAYNLGINVTVHTIGRTDTGLVDDVFTHSINTNLKDGILKWNGELKKAQPGAITSTRTVIQEGRLWGIPVFWLRIILPILAGMLVILLLCFIFRFIKADNKKMPAGNLAVQVGRKYKAMIVEVVERPLERLEQDVIDVRSLDDLIKVAQNLLKPINHISGPDKHLWWVIDGTVRYQYQMIEKIVPTPESSASPTVNS